MSGAVVKFRPRTVRFAHELECSGCGERVYCAVHWGPIDFCLTCQELGPEAHRRLLTFMVALAQVTSSAEKLL